MTSSSSSSSQKCDRSADNRLDHEEIEVFCRELLRRPELDAVFIRYSANSCVLSTVDLRDFLKDQGEDASLIHAQSLILTYELNEWGTALSTGPSGSAKRGLSIPDATGPAPNGRLRKVWT